MINLKRVVFALVVMGALAGTAIPAQNMSGTVVEHRVNFPKGTSGTTVKGTAKYGMSYVYKLGASSGQQMNIDLTSNGARATFSLIAPDTETVANAFGVKTWSGGLAQSGDYSIVVVMNDDKAGNVPFQLKISIK